MPMDVHETLPAEDHAVEATLRLRDDGVIAGTVYATESKPTPFHGWLELMDALESIRAHSHDAQGA